MATSRGGDVEVLLVEQVVTERFQQALWDFLECAPEGQDAFMAIFLSQGPVQAAVVQQLHVQLA